MEGWVKLHRKLLESPVFQNEKLLKVFIWCLLKASHAEHAELVGLQKVSIHPGQFVYGRHKAAEELKIKESTLYKYMMWLKDEEILNIQSNNKFSVVTVANWDLYQTDEPKSNSKSSSKVTTKEQQKNTNKNDKNEKNNNTVLSFSEFWDLYDKKRGDKTKLEKKYDKISEEDRKKIKAHVKAYKLAQPDKQFRKDPATYLNNRGWEDEIIYSHKSQVKQQNQPMDLTGRW